MNQWQLLNKVCRAENSVCAATQPQCVPGDWAKSLSSPAQLCWKALKNFYDTWWERKVEMTLFHDIPKALPRQNASKERGHPPASVPGPLRFKGSQAWIVTRLTNHWLGTARWGARVPVLRGPDLLGPEGLRFGAALGCPDLFILNCLHTVLRGCIRYFHFALMHTSHVLQSRCLVHSESGLASLGQILVQRADTRWPKIRLCYGKGLFGPSPHVVEIFSPTAQWFLEVINLAHAPCTPIA